MARATWPLQPLVGGSRRCWHRDLRRPVGAKWSVLFKRRQELRKLEEAEAAGESFWTSAFAPEVRVKILHAVNDATSQQWNGVEVVQLARDLLLRDEGLVTLTSQYDPRADFFEFVGRCADEMVASCVEAVALTLRAKANSDWLWGDPYRRFGATVNRVLSQHRVAYELIETEMVPLESQELHAEVVVPVLRLLSGRPGWGEVEAAYQAALREIADGDPADAVTDAGRALQKALEACGATGNALGPLIGSAKSSGLLGPHDSNLTSGIEKLMHWVSADRSVTGEAHHSGTTAREDAWLAVHVVGALILRLAGPPRGASS